MSVWILVVYVSTSIYGGGPMVIDNIASSSECERVRAILVEKRGIGSGTAFCLEVRKTPAR